MNYRLVTPKGQPEITLGTPTGNVTLKNGQILPESPVVLSYPHLFTKIETGKQAKPEVMPVEVKVEMVENTKEEPKKSIIDLLKEATPKRKVGRPKKGF